MQQSGQIILDPDGQRQQARGQIAAQRSQCVIHMRRDHVVGVAMHQTIRFEQLQDAGAAGQTYELGGASAGGAGGTLTDMVAGGAKSAAPPLGAGAQPC